MKALSPHCHRTGKQYCRSLRKIFVGYRQSSSVGRAKNEVNVMAKQLSKEYFVWNTDEHWDLHTIMTCTGVLLIQSHYLYAHEQKAKLMHIILCIVGTVNGQLKYTICDTCRSILSILKPVFRQLRQIHRTYESPTHSSFIIINLYMYLYSPSPVYYHYILH